MDEDNIKRKLLEELVELMGSSIGNKVKPCSCEEEPEDPQEEKDERGELEVSATGDVAKDLKSRIDNLMKKKK